LRRRPRTCVRRRYIGRVLAAACENRKPVRVRADDSRWPIQRAHRFHGAPQTHWLTVSIVHAARRFGMAKYRFKRVPTRFCLTQCFFTAVTKYECRNPIISASMHLFVLPEFTGRRRYPQSHHTSVGNSLHRCGIVGTQGMPGQPSFAGSVSGTADRPAVRPRRDVRHSGQDRRLHAGPRQVGEYYPPLPEEPISIPLTECTRRSHPFLRFKAAIPARCNTQRNAVEI
jgi:hypothetical protein